MLCNRMIIGPLRCRPKQLQVFGVNFVPSRNSQSRSNMLRRFLVNNNERKKSRKWHTHKILSNPAVVFQPQFKGEKISHRLTVLNKIFMENICDILSTGDQSQLFTGNGLEISKVKVSPDLSGINVYWICTGIDVDKNLEEILEKNSHFLRHELSQQGVIGRVPPIKFIKDRHHAKLLELERRFAVADYGPDHNFDKHDLTDEETGILVADLPDHPKSTLEFHKDKETDVFRRALAIASSQSNELEESVCALPPDLPVMKNNVFGVNTPKIYEWVQKSMIKARADHRKSQEVLPPASANLHHNEDIGFHSPSTRTTEIRKWAAKYVGMRKNIRKETELEFLSKENEIYSEEEEEEGKDFIQDSYEDI